MSKFIQLFLGLFLAAQITSAHGFSQKSFADRKEVHSFILEMEKKHHFNTQKLKALFKTVYSEPKILKLISKPYERLPWYRYQMGLVTPERIQGGITFWNENKKALQKAEMEFGVPAEIIVAIIGIETRYGKTKGKWPVLQTLATLAFDYPKRAKFFRKELEEFLLLTREQKLDPVKMVGSYAGAIGTPQFMPSSYRRYAVDFSGRGQSDLINNVNDAIGSVAHYFQAHGWKSGESIAHPAKILGKRHQSLNKKDRQDPKPKISIKELAQYGVYPNQKSALPNEETLTAFITLEQAEDSEYWLGLHNFYVITRYNPSTHYAMAVFRLSQQIQAQKSK